MALATFGAGCFWGIEESFRNLSGVINTIVGYTGGILPNPTYEDVCSNKTGHVEAVQVEYNPDKIPYEDLVRFFWKIHDPTTLNRQGPDVGTQYRSAIFYHSPEQQATATKIKKELENSGVFEAPIITEIIAATTFYPAEEYHQRYLEKKGIKQCHS